MKVTVLLHDNFLGSICKLNQGLDPPEAKTLATSSTVMNRFALKQNFNIVVVNGDRLKDDRTFFGSTTSNRTAPPMSGIVDILNAAAATGILVCVGLAHKNIRSFKLFIF